MSSVDWHHIHVVALVNLDAGELFAGVDVFENFVFEDLVGAVVVDLAVVLIIVEGRLWRFLVRVLVVLLESLQKALGDFLELVHGALALLGVELVLVDGVVGSDDVIVETHGYRNVFVCRTLG